MISAAMVKELREKTGAGMMDCKKALTENNGDFEASVDWLKTKGLAAAAKKAGRVAAEGLTSVAVRGKIGAAIELNSETDFVARNKQFQSLVSEIANLALDYDNFEDLTNASTNSGKNVSELVTENIAIIGENLNLRRSSRIQVENGVVASYVHNSEAENMGKISVIIALESEGNKDELQKLGHKLAMHVAAARPMFLSISDVSPEVIQRERDIFVEQTKDSGKPQNVIEKMVEGRIRKFFEEIVLLEQPFVMDPKLKISDYLITQESVVGAKIQLKNFIRFELGEGIEVEQKNFADEVAAVTKQ